jgi:hypothetical protein
MHETMAWELLNDHEYCSQLPMVDFEDLMVQAGYKYEVVHKVAMERGWNRMCSGSQV